MRAAIEMLRHFLVAYGYWTVAALLLLENAGLPVPGETVLILAAALSYSTHELRLPWIIVTAIVAATFGDNIGYLIGHKGGRPLLERWRHLFRISSDHIRQAELLLDRHGSIAIFFARFVAGARIIAGPLAGTLRMEWKRFALFNFLGAVFWVSVISGVAYAFGSQLDRLLALFDKLNYITVLALLALLLVWWLWRLLRRK